MGAAVGGGITAMHYAPALYMITMFVCSDAVKCVCAPIHSLPQIVYEAFVYVTNNFTVVMVVVVVGKVGDMFGRRAPIGLIIRWSFGSAY